MTMHPSTFEYLKPSDTQLLDMAHMRTACAAFAANLDMSLPDGPDKTYILRKFREVSFWVNVSLTRNSDGSPRDS